MKKILFSLMLFISQSAFAQRVSHYDTVDVAIRKMMNDEHIPGVAAGVVKDGKLAWYKAYGHADIASGKAMSIDGIMNIGSVSKTFTTVAVMQLWERGLVDLNADVNTYLDFKVRNPKFPEKPVTITQILLHTSSIGDGRAYMESYTCGDPDVSLHDWLEGILAPGGKYYNSGDTYKATAPGDTHSYSNVAFGLLGLIVENVSKRPFNIYCKEYIFNPLGMKNTAWMLRDVDTKKHITPYVYITSENRNDIMTMRRLFGSESEFKPESYVPVCLYSFYNYPDGLLRSSVREMSYFLTALMNGGELNGKRILKKETVNKMLSPQSSGNNYQGLTFRTSSFKTSDENVTLWGHSGLDPGIQTFMYFNPATKTGVITFQNNPGDGSPSIVGKLYEAASDSK